MAKVGLKPAIINVNIELTLEEAKGLRSILDRIICPDVTEAYGIGNLCAALREAGVELSDKRPELHFNSSGEYVCLEKNK